MECNYVNYFDISGNDQQFYVGKGGVTKILRVVYSPEPFCTKFYVEIYIEDKLAVELYRFNEVGIKNHNAMKGGQQ